MRKILIFVLVLISFQSFGQSNYTFINGFYRWRGGMFDSSLHIPRYCGTPSGLRTGSSVQDGAVAIDTCNNKLYFYSGGSWLESGSTYTANLPIRITGTVISADTSVAYIPSLTTNARLKKITDSLTAGLIVDTSVAIDPSVTTNKRSQKLVDSIFSVIDIINKGNLGQDYLIKYDTTTGEFYTFNPNVLNRRMVFQVGVTTGFTDLGGEHQLVDSNFIDYTIIGITKNGFDLKPQDSTYGYYHQSASGQVYFGQVLNDSDIVVIRTVWTPSYANLTRRIAQPPPEFIDFDFDAAHDLEELTTDQWTIKGTASTPYTAVASGPVKIPSGQDGAYSIQIFTSNGYDGIIGLDATTTNNDYPNFDYWAQVPGDFVIRVNENTSGSINTGVSVSDGDYIAIWREGSTVTLRKSSNGVTWSVVYTYSATTTGDLYPKADCTFMGARKLYNPQGYNVQ